MSTVVDSFEYVEMLAVGASKSGKTRVFDVLNRKSGDELGMIAWFGPWRQYTFRADPLAVFSAGCLNDIAAFVEEQTDLQRRGVLKPWGATR